jgi:hypothetical protein
MPGPAGDNVVTSRIVVIVPVPEQAEDLPPLDAKVNALDRLGVTKAVPLADAPAPADLTPRREAARRRQRPRRIRTADRTGPRTQVRAG